MWSDLCFRKTTLSIEKSKITGGETSLGDGRLTQAGGDAGLNQGRAPKWEWGKQVFRMEPTDLGDSLVILRVSWKKETLRTILWWILEPSSEIKNMGVRANQDLGKR